MKLNEPTAALRRIFFVIYVEDGSALASDGSAALEPEIPDGATQVALNTSALVDAAGVFFHVGDGLYCYEFALAEVATQGFAAFVFSRTGFRPQLAWTNVGDVFGLGETDVTALRVPFAIYDDGGVLATGATFTTGGGGGYPANAADVDVALGTVGATFLHGYLCNDAGPDIAPLFDDYDVSPSSFLANSGAPTFADPGFLGGGDTAITFPDSPGSANLYHDEFPTAYELGAGDDVIAVLVAKVNQNNGNLGTERSLLYFNQGALIARWRLYVDDTALHFQLYDGTSSADVSIDLASVAATDLLAEWVVILAVIDRATDTIRLAVAGDAGAGLVSAAASASIAGFVGTPYNDGMFLGGSSEATSQPASLSALFLGAGAGAAGTIPSMTTAAESFYNSLSGAVGTALQVSKNGDAFVDSIGGGVEIDYGFYYYQGAASDADTEGVLAVKYEKTGYGTQHVTIDVTAASVSAPIISDITPTENIEPGEPGAFSATFKTARLTPITFHLAEIAASTTITIAVKYDNRIETYTARDAEGAWLWPFDVEADNTISDVVDGEADVSMLPRGGWPPARVEFKVAASIMAVES